MAELKAKNLARTVARAFYDDDVVVIVDALCREKYIMDHEQPGRGPLEEKFGVQSKQIRKTLQQLYDDCLIEKYTRKYKDPNAEKGTRKKLKTFWYINYLHFVKIVKLRLHFMIKALTEEEEKQVTMVGLYACPRCGIEFNLMDAMEYTDEETGQFFCSFCFKETDEKVFLQDGDMGQPRKSSHKASPVSKGQKRSLKEKREEQISASRGFRDGLQDILLEIENFPIAPPTNLPYEHIANAKIEHQQQKEEEELLRSRTGGSSSGLNSKNTTKYVDLAGRNVTVRILTDEAFVEELKQKEEADQAYNSLPVWMMRDVKGQMTTNAMQDAKERAAKRAKAGVISAAAAANLARGGAGTLLDAKIAKTGAPPTTPGVGPRKLQRTTSEINWEDAKREFENKVQVMVLGQPKILRDITREDENNMTDPEYDEYIRVLLQIEGEDSSDSDLFF